jgi:hypothetical protein
MAQSFLDRLLEFFEDGLGQAFALHFFAEDVAGKEILDRHLFEINARRDRLETGERGNGRGAGVRGPHVRELLKKFDRQIPPRSPQPKVGSRGFYPI